MNSNMNDDDFSNDESPVAPEEVRLERFVQLKNRLDLVCDFYSKNQSKEATMAFEIFLENLEREIAEFFQRPLESPTSSSASSSLTSPTTSELSTRDPIDFSNEALSEINKNIAHFALSPFPDEIDRFELNWFRFLKMGGKVSCISQQDEEQRPHIELEKDMVIFPVCEAGENRSQVMFHVLQKLHDPALVFPPHGARGGCDPYSVCIAKGETSDDAMISYLHSSIDLDSFLSKSFELAFGKAKQKRAGETWKEWDPTKVNPVDGNMSIRHMHSLAEYRQTLRKQFDSRYYSIKNHRNNPDLQGPMLFIAFRRAAGIVIQRLVENNDDLTGVHVVCMPWGDDIGQAGSDEQIRRARDQGYDGPIESLRTELAVQTYHDVAKQYRNIFKCQKSSTNNQ